jgi:hypothetical protein
MANTVRSNIKIPRIPEDASSNAETTEKVVNYSWGEIEVNGLERLQTSGLAWHHRARLPHGRSP